MDKKVWIAIAAVGLFFLMKKGNKSDESLSGFGVGGRGRLGNPKTDAERRASHQARFGNTNLPPRGTGLGY